MRERSLADCVFALKNEGFCIENDGFCIENDEFCIENDCTSAVYWPALLWPRQLLPGE